MKKIAIIGGGITGLSLAHFLLKKGHRVSLFEQEQQLGGLVSTFPFAAGLLEKFYHHFFAQDDFAFKLLEELEIKDKLYWSYPRMGFLVEEKIYPFTTPLDLLRFKPLTPAERLRLGLFSLQIRKDEAWQVLDNIKAKDWLVKKLGQKIYRLIWEPMLRAKFGKHAEEISAAWMWARIRARGKTRSFFGSREKLGYLRGSYQVLVDALAKQITQAGAEINLGKRIESVPLPGFDLTVVTCAHPSLSKYLPPYLGNICLVLELKRSFSPMYWINIADPSLPFCAVVEHTNAFDNPLYQGAKIVYLSNYIEQEHAIWRLSDQGIYVNYVSGLKKIRKDFEENEVVAYHVFREKYAQPLPLAGYGKKIPPFKINDRLFLVSNAQIYPEDRGVNNSIKLAWEFSEQL